MKKSKNISVIITICLIIVLAFIIPMQIVRNYSQLSNDAGLPRQAFDELVNSELTNTQRNYAIMFKKSCSSNLSRLKTGQTLLFIYFVIFISIAMLLIGFFMKKYNPQFFKLCLLLYFLFIAGILTYIILVPINL